MAQNSGIEWTDHTFNPWIGCTRVSPACDNCYAETLATGRLGREWGPHAARRRTKTWGDPVRWNRQAEGATVRPRVFVASLADVFDNHKSIEDAWRRELWALIRQCRNLDFLLLTKRPQNILRYLPSDWGKGYPNVWLGATVENQTEADRRIPSLLSVQARVHFLSMEPLLGPVDLTDLPDPSGLDHSRMDALRGKFWMKPEHVTWPVPAGTTVNGRTYVNLCGWIDWIITGGESGGTARPSNPQWFRSLRDQCADAGVPYLHKQNGEWVSVSEVEGPGRHHTFEDGRTVRRIGKKRAGRTLDGVIHDGFPVPMEILQ